MAKVVNLSPKTKAAPQKSALHQRLDEIDAWTTAGAAKLEAGLRERIAPLVTATGLSAPEQAQIYRVLRTASDRLVVALAGLEQAVDLYKSQVIPKAFEDEKITSFTTQDGYRVTVQQRFYASIIKEQQDKAFAWLRSHGMSDLIFETVNASTLSAAGKRLIEDDKRELPDHLFKTAYLPTTSLTKVK